MLALNTENPKASKSSERRNIFALGFVSFFTDMSNEMIFSLLPTFLLGIPGSSRVILGLIEGTAEALSYALRAVSGFFSDKFRKRKTFVMIAMIGMTPGLVGLTYLTSFLPLLISSFVLGFFLLGAGAPVGFQYVAEVTFPAPESSSQGMLLFVGQISGILFIIGMNSFGMIQSMMVFIAFAVVNIGLTFLIKESSMIQTELTT